RGNGDIHGHGAGRGQVDVVVDELAPGIYPVRHAAAVVQVLRVGLIGDQIADGPRRGQVLAVWRVDAIGVVGRRDPRKVGVGRAERGIGSVVADAVDRLDALRPDNTRDRDDARD